MQLILRIHSAAAALVVDVDDHAYVHADADDAAYQRRFRDLWMISVKWNVLSWVLVRVDDLWLRWHAARRSSSIYSIICSYPSPH